MKKEEAAEGMGKGDSDEVLAYFKILDPRENFIFHTENLSKLRRRFFRYVFNNKLLSISCGGLIYYL